VSAACVSLSVTPNGTKTGLNGTGLGVTAAVTHAEQNDTLTGATISWGDGTSSSILSGSATHLYPRSGSYTAQATLVYAKSGTITSPACKKQVNVYLTCPSGSTPNEDYSNCVKDGSTTPCPPGTTWSDSQHACVSDGSDTGVPGPNPPDDNPTSAQCWWENAGTYNGHTHASNDPVSDEDMVYAGGVCPVGSTDH
jgi:hypothetical protein